MGPAVTTSRLANELSYFYRSWKMRHCCACGHLEQGTGIISEESTFSACFRPVNKRDHELLMMVITVFRR